MQKLLLFGLILILFSCKNEVTSKLKTGIYRAELVVNNTENLPFLFEVVSDKYIKVFNAEETIEVEDITFEADSVIIKLPVFEGFIKAKIVDEILEGNFIKESLNRIVPFTASKNEERFTVSKDAKTNVTGNWETVFSPDSKNDNYIAKGVFKQKENKVTGTFRTTTGDYRFLEGVLNGNELKLSAFDGAHAFLFTAIVNDSIMHGDFYSGNHWKEPFIAKRNDNFELPNANDLTFLKEGFEKIEFSFPDATGKQVSLNDKRFKNKVVLVQIMGTWCPNCLDESKYYAEFYKNNRSKNLEIVALAFEYAKTPEKAFKSINRLKNKVGIDYPILLAQYGTSSKAKAQEKLPMLNHVLSYPTTIFIDKTGKVRKIHTGFNGPATGKKFSEFKAEFTSFVDSLLVE